MLDFRMETFLAVCRHMNYTRAAEELRITQPAVSQHIRCLEEYYDAPLFAREGKRIRLTCAGQEVRAAAMAMAHDELLLRRRLQEEGERQLNFGATLTVGEFVIPETVGRYLAAHPDVRLRMTVANTQELLKELDEGAIDFALVEGYFPKNEYDHLPYAAEPYVAVCGAGQSGGKRKIEDLLSGRLIVREKGSGTREILERYLEERNLKLEDFAQTAEISSICAIKRLVEAGLGITFLYEAAVREELARGTIETIGLSGFAPTHDLTFLWRRGSVFADDWRGVYKEWRSL